MQVKKSIVYDKDVSIIWNKLVEHHLPDFDQTSLLQLDKVSLTFSLLVVMHVQIMNGSVIQFVDNSSGLFFDETIEAAKEIEFQELVDILISVTKKFPSRKVPKDWEKRREAIDMVNEDCGNFWEELDSIYYKNEKIFYNKTIEYLKNNAELID